MITHAEYHAAHPLPSAVWCCNPIPENFCLPQLGAGHVHMMDAGVRFYPAEKVSTEDYIAALSKTTWRDSAYLAFALDVSQSAAKGRMLNGVMAELTECKKMSGKWVWRLL